MCGIAGFIIKDPSNAENIDRERLVDALINGIDHRGGDATGFVARNREGHIEWQKASTDAHGFLPHRRRLPLDADVCLAHTRWATQGDKAFPENNHPVKRGPMYLIHNGVVMNDAALFAATGRRAYGQVDSEALAALMSFAGTLDKRTGPLMETVDGSAAIATMDERDGTVMLARISSSPLYILNTRRVILFGSTSDAVESAHRLAIGSLGRAKAVNMLEGAAIVIHEGVASSFTFEAPRYIAPTYTWLDRGDDVTGSYLPGRAQGTSCNLPALVSSPLSPKTSDVCEICRGIANDLYTLNDGDDQYDVCEYCWDLYSEIVPGGREEARSRRVPFEWENEDELDDEIQGALARMDARHAMRAIGAGEKA